jgi:hypothetical protein
LIKSTPDTQPKDALAHSLDDAEVLVAYVVRNNIQGTQEAVEGVAEARELFTKGELKGDAQRRFYASFSKLAATVAPVTVATLKASLEQYGPGRRSWFGLGPRVPCSYAQCAARSHRAWAMLALVTMLVVQSYWLIGSNLLNAMPKLTDAQRSAMAAFNAKESLMTRASSGEATPAPLSAQPPSDKDIAEAQAWQAAWEVRQERDRIADMLIDWSRLALPKGWFPTRSEITAASLRRGEKFPSLSELDKVSPERVIALSSRILEVLQQYVLPLLYGWLGAMAYVLRTLGQQARERLYSVENQTDFQLRVWLGIVAGLAIGWFFRGDKGDGAAVGSISALALAFVAGYSVDLLFTAMDRIVGAFSSSGDKPKAKDENSTKAQPAVK